MASNIIIEDLNNIKVYSMNDGGYINAGKFEDVKKNYPQFADELETAKTEYLALIEQQAQQQGGQGE